MSTKKLPKQKVTFSILAPEARDVKLVGDFSDWEQRPIELRKLKSGQWKATIALPEGKYQYRYLVDGNWYDDPQCPTRIPNQFGSQNCVRIVPQS